MSRHPWRDPALDDFRHGIAALLIAGTVRGHVATVVDTFRTPFHPVRRQERVWLLLTWANGRREQLLEDYPPWTSVAELRAGHFVWTDPQHGDVDFEARWLAGEDHDNAWRQWGITNDLSTYMTPP